jgi:hypothetical protein
MRQLKATDLLLDGRGLGYRSTEASRLLIELLDAQGDRDGALSVAKSDAAFLSDQDRCAIQAALGQGVEHGTC